MLMLCCFWNAGNKNLCGNPLDKCVAEHSTESKSDDGSKSSTEPQSPPSSVPETSRSSRDHRTLRVLIIAVVVLALLITAFALVVILHRRNQSPQSIEAPPPLDSKDNMKSLDHDGPNHTHRVGGGTKLSFVKDERQKFDLADLLKASADVLGNGCFGSSYRAALPMGSMMVVKSFKQMNNAAKCEFHEHMRRLGRLEHPNLLPMVAYCYRKEEKLLITDFIERGNLSVHLHGMFVYSTYNPTHEHKQVQ